jgi:hypothetical protein
VIVKELSAQGTASARLRPDGADPALDQTVVIRLTPRAAH